MTPRKIAVRPSLLLFACILLWCGCSPSVTPLYRDYRYDPAGFDSVQLRLKTMEALHEAGWTTVDSAVPGVVATDDRTLAHLGLYSVGVNVEAVPMSDRYVRLFVHPYRKWLTGGRSKLPLLPGNVRRAIIPDLNAAFKSQGLIPVGTPEEKEKIRLTE